MNECLKAAMLSNKFERLQSDLKREYVLKNIITIREIMSKIDGHKGSFGTGFPFYALNPDFTGVLPIIDEQIRYNDELYQAATDIEIWPCAKCLENEGLNMPDLKQICKPCPKVDDKLKPRKVINRLPDVDMWLVCADDKVESAKVKLKSLLEGFGMRTSDVDPVGTIKDLEDIVSDLECEKMPEKYLPIDVHIIEYSKISSILDRVAYVVLDAALNGSSPYIPIHPVSLRKTWQHDDMAYNFIFDYLYSFTPFDFEEELMKKFEFSKNLVSEKLDSVQFEKMLYLSSPDSARRRNESEDLKRYYKERIKTWKK